MAASFNTSPTLITYLDNISYQINITTSNSTGTFAVQASDDYEVDPPTGKVTNSGNWITLTLSGTPTVAGANDNIIISLAQAPFKAVRLAYTSTVAGTGHADIWINAKAVGG